MPVRLPIGTVMQGYVFRGGDPSQESAWTPDVSANLSTEERKELSSAHTASANARRAAGQAGEFMRLNGQQRTGGIYGIPGASEVRGWFEPKMSTLQGLSNRMIPNMHVTPGPMTDADAKMYRSAIPNPNNPRQTNANLTAGIQRQDAELRAKAAYYDKYAMVHGTLRGADAGFANFWGRYSADPKAYAPDQSRGPGAQMSAGWSIQRVR